MVDKLIALAYDLASTELQPLLACRQCDPLKVSTTRIPPLPTLHLLLRECMEWFWTDGDSFHENTDPFPGFRLRKLLGPLYRSPRPMVDREKGIKFVRGRRVKARLPTVDETSIFDDSLAMPEPLVEPLAKLQLTDISPDPERMGTSE